MADSRNAGGRGRKLLTVAVRAGGLVVASGLISGGVQAKDADKKALKIKDPGSTMAVKQAPNAAPAKPAPGSTMAWKLAPNSAAAKKGDKGGPVKAP